MGVCLNATFKAEEMSVSCSCIHANIQNTSLIQTGLRHSIVKVIWAKMNGYHFDAFLCSKHKSLLQVFCSNKQPDAALENLANSAMCWYKDGTAQG